MHTISIFGLQKLNTLNLRHFHPPLNPYNHFSAVLIKTNWYTISCKYIGCSGLTSVTIPSSVTSIGTTAFMGCTGLTSIIVDKDNMYYDSRDNCNAFIQTSNSCLLAGCSNTKIPKTVKRIYDGAFQGRTGLTSVTIPEGVTIIGPGAFSGCTGLTSISIPSNVRNIHGSSFSGCSALTSITVDSGNKYYDSRDNCNAIIKTKSNELVAGCKNTDIPSSVTSIGDDAFNGCTGLESVTIPGGVTRIGRYVFYNCIGLGTLVCHAITPPSSYRAFKNVDKHACKFSKTWQLHKFWTFKTG